MKRKYYEIRDIKKLSNVPFDLVGLGRVWLTSEIDSGYKNKNIGFYPKSQRLFLRILCVVDDYARRRILSGLREDAFGALARNHSYLHFG